jgi:hypothetical protein
MLFAITVSIEVYMDFKLKQSFNNEMLSLTSVSSSMSRVLTIIIRKLVKSWDSCTFFKSLFKRGKSLKIIRSDGDKVSIL